MAVSYDVVIAGGGPAGSAAAIRCAEGGRSVLLLEKGSFPRQKVCGEFVSAEAVDMLARFGIMHLPAAAPQITQARLFVDGRTIHLPIRAAASSITRYELDQALWKQAQAAGADCRSGVNVGGFTRTTGGFEIRTGEAVFLARSLVIAAGRWSNLAARPLPREKWLGLKAHFAGAANDNSVDLYFFRGGYVGVQAIGEGQLNACGLVRAEVATNMKATFTADRRLCQASYDWQQITQTCATAPVSFGIPEPIRDGVIHVGDAAGFIDPFAGDGISMALHGGALAGQAILDSRNYEDAAVGYERAYRQRLTPAFRSAARLRRLTNWPERLRSPLLDFMRLPFVGDWLVRSTRAA